MTEKAVYCRHHDAGVDDEVYCGVADSPVAAKQAVVEYLGVFAEDVMDHVEETDFAFYAEVDS